MEAQAIPEIDAATIGDAARFRDEVVAACRPVVLRGIGRDWPLVAAAQRGNEALFAYLCDRDTGEQAQAFVGQPAIAGRYTYGDNPDGFNFARETMSVSALVERCAAAAGPDAPSIYMGSLPADAFLAGFGEACPLSLLPGVAPRVWLGTGSTVACHYDTFDNLACVAAGRRRFTIWPPDAIGDLYVGPIDHTMAGQPVALAVGAAANDPRFPRFEGARGRALTAELQPGDALFLPKLWWHQVEATGRFNVLVNYWWDAFADGLDAPYTTMLLAMAAIAERPAAERAAWSAFFDHYVFRPRGHPMEHLPPERHGILAAGQGRRLRALVMRMLRG